MELLRSKHLPMTQQFHLQMSTSPCCQKRPTGYGAPLRSMSWSILSAFQPLTVMPERVALGVLVS